MTEDSYQTVLIVGASGGIGSAISRAFAKQGAALSLASNDEPGLSIIAKECKTLGAKTVIQIVSDISNKDGIEKTVKETMKSNGKLNVLVNSAGLASSIGGFESSTIEEYDALFNLNLRAPFFLTQMCIPHLEKTKGSVVNISSMVSHMYIPSVISYCLTKAALDHFTKTSALELAEKGIRVNAVNPGPVHTNIMQNIKMDVGVDQLWAAQALLNPLAKRNVEADEIADAVLFLSSNAAKMITGVCLNVDGGRVLTGK